ncbi:MAG: Riboflavin synthase [Candidatus Celerinatantimonas neptuna]|nr:MAG: Riboflavin synthase [Candidatus Celerinatantimonas neptuna]
MFTGIIEASGQVCSLVRRGGDLQLTLISQTLSMADVRLGDSIAVNGVCLTVTDFGDDFFTVDVSIETLSRSSLEHLKQGSVVNLEKAMAANGRFGGHMVSGHVDGVGTIANLSKSGRAIDIWLSYPAELGRYIAEKGSITVDGISLTVNELDVDGHQLRLTIIPHTLLCTTIQNWRTGSKVNIEVDVVARYLERLLAPASGDVKSSGLTMAKLAEYGFLSGLKG